MRARSPRAQSEEMTITPAEVCNGCPGRPHVVVVIAHRRMRELTVELLRGDRGRWAVSAVSSASEVDNDASTSDLVVIDTADLASVRRTLPATLALARVIVISPEPDLAYRNAALRCGAGGWLSRDRVAEDLCDTVCATLADVRRSQRTSAEQPSESIRTGEADMTIDGTTAPEP